MKPKDTLTAAEARALFAKDTKPIRAKPEKKIQSAAEQMDITSSPIQEIIDRIVVKTEYAEYHAEHINITYKGKSYKVTVTPLPSTL